MVPAWGRTCSDGERNALALLVNAQNHELARFVFVGNAGRLDDKPLDAGGEELSVQDFEHVVRVLALQDIFRNAGTSRCDTGHA